jgi:hypothetical protein
MVLHEMISFPGKSGDKTVITGMDIEANRYTGFLIEPTLTEGWQMSWRRIAYSRGNRMIGE